LLPSVPLLSLSPRTADKHAAAAAAAAAASQLHALMQPSARSSPLIHTCATSHLVRRQTLASHTDTAIRTGSSRHTPLRPPRPPAAVAMMPLLPLWLLWTLLALLLAALLYPMRAKRVQGFATGGNLHMW